MGKPRTEQLIAKNGALIARLRYEIREQTIARKFDDQANLARLISRQLDCGIDREIRKQLREQRVLKMLVGEQGELS